MTHGYYYETVNLLDADPEASAQINAPQYTSLNRGRYDSSKSYLPLLSLGHPFVTLSALSPPPLSTQRTSYPGYLLPSPAHILLFSVSRRCSHPTRQA